MTPRLATLAALAAGLFLLAWGVGAFVDHALASVQWVGGGAR